MPRTSLPAGPFLLTDPSLGINPRGLRRLVARGEVRRVVRGVGVRADVEDTVLVRAQAAWLVLRPGQVVVDHSAAWLHGLDVGPGSASDASGTILLEVADITGRRAIRAAGTNGCRRSVPPGDVVDVHGVPATSPVRTAADLACRRGRYDALAVLDAFARHHGVGPEDHRPVVDRFAGRRGVTQYRELVPLIDPRAESVRESWTRLAALDHGVRGLEPQVVVWTSGLGWCRLDLADRRRRIAVEYDGADHHGDEEQQRHDAVRRGLLTAEGWCFVVVRSGDFVEPGLSRWTGELRAAYEDRSGERRRRWARGEDAGRHPRW